MFHIGQYRRRIPKLADHLPWAVFIDGGLLLNKDGSFQTTYRFRGPDRESQTEHDLVSFRAQLNNALHRLGTRWAIYIEAQRGQVRDYPSSRFPDPVTQLIDDQRRQGFEADGSYCETHHYLTFVYLPPSEQAGRAQQLFFETDKSTPAVDYRKQLQGFREQARSVTGVLGGLMPDVEPLDTSATLTYLHSCVSTRQVNMAAPPCPAYIDTLVSDCPLVGGVSLRMADQSLKTVSVKAFPSRTVPALLHGLNHLPFGYRWVVRWLPLGPADALKQLHAKRSHWFRKRKSLGSLFKEAVLKQDVVMEDPDALAKVQDADAALTGLGDGGLSFGYLNLTVSVLGRDEAQALDRAKAVQEVVDSQGFGSTVETVNALESWLGSLPGQVYADVRGPMMMSLNLCDLVPAHSFWGGPNTNKHLNGPVLLHCKTQGATPFRFSNFFGDVGHLMIIGRTGSGKTTLLNLMAAQFRRYPNSQVFIFDKGMGCRALTLAVGGEFYDLESVASGNSAPGSKANAHTGLSFQPLRHVDNESERLWASEWLLDILKQEGVELNPTVKKKVWQALENLASHDDPGERTLSVFVGLLQDPQAKEALKHYTLEGAYGRFFDGDHEQLGSSDWQVFETEGLLTNKSVATPLLLYLFHRLEQRFTTGRPTLVILDEAWQVLLISLFAAKFREWMKVLRKKNVSLVFATQDLKDITESPVASAVIDNCPTRVFLANRQATDPVSRAVYEQFGLNDTQINLIANAVAKRQYYFQSPEGNRLFELGLGDVELAFVGSGSAQDQQLINRILQEHGKKDFAHHLLQAKGLDVTARQLEAIHSHER